MSLRLFDTVPDFTQDSTIGSLSLYDWAGDSWVVLFSHPHDAPPVCAAELDAVAKLLPEFERRGVKVVGLSLDPVDRHGAWREGTASNFPLIADHDRRVAELLGLIHPGASDTVMARSVLVIDPARRVRLTLTYPAATGRNFAGILRVIDSLQLADSHKVATRADWHQGEDILPSLTAVAAKELFPNGWTTRAGHPRTVAQHGGIA